MDGIMRKLPIGIQTFEKLREGGYLYVDKTAFVWKIASTETPYFLSRPRRFGKSLLLSTFEAYFEGRKELFEGLAIAELEKEWKKYPVFHLDLNAEKYDSSQALVEILSRHLTQWELKYGKGEDEETLSGRFAGVIRRASEQAGCGVVVSCVRRLCFCRRNLYRDNQSRLSGCGFFLYSIGVCHWLCV